jgi:hypothetical protein
VGRWVARARVAGAGAVLALVAGCTGMGSAEDQNAAGSATRFYRALAGDPSSACAWLAPGTLQELEQSDGPCPGSLRQLHLPRAGTVTRVEVYGKDAMVRLDDDVVFLARFDQGWRITAAGCTPEPGRPYTCTLKGA